MSKNRTFTIDNSCIKVQGGRYKSSSPLSAARKAATRLFKKAKSMSAYKTSRKLTFSIRETTEGSKKKIFHYKVERVKLAKPIEREINGVKIINHFKIKIKTDKNKVKNTLKCSKVSKSLSES
jgi:hypothetical protein